MASISKPRVRRDYLDRCELLEHENIQIRRRLKTRSSQTGAKVKVWIPAKFSICNT